MSFWVQDRLSFWDQNLLNKAMFFSCPACDWDSSIPGRSYPCHYVTTYKGVLLTWPKTKDKEHDKDKGHDKDIELKLLSIQSVQTLSSWQSFWFLTIKTDTEQHSQFLQCFNDLEPEFKRRHVSLQLISLPSKHSMAIPAPLLSLLLCLPGLGESIGSPATGLVHTW